MRGFVGARKRTFVVGNDLRRSSARSNATNVLPKPVGRTTSVLYCFAVSKIFCWYSRGVMLRRDMASERMERS